jgi:hypothetical protein
VAILTTDSKLRPVVVAIRLVSGLVEAVAIKVDHGVVVALWMLDEVPESSLGKNGCTE